MAVAASIAFSLLATLPLLIVWVGGLIVAGTIWNRQRPVALLVASGSLLAILTEICARIATSTLPFLYSGARRSVAQIGGLIAAVGLISSLLHAVAWGLILAAVVHAVAHRPAQHQ
jgi:type IV secretory pathway TrbD component